MEIVKKTLKDILSDFDKIIIPDVQRDYVMGSGGKKFVDLLDAMDESYKIDEKFNFSCLVGYKDENNCFHVYDGQQRLVTLIYLCAYLIEDNESEEFKLLKKFSFIEGRELANLWLKSPKQITESLSVDFTTYSLAKLIEEFNKMPANISYSFFLNKVVFDMIIVDKVSDAEQFFLDINDGLDLKPYEVFKAELFHRGSKLMDKESFKRFALKMENKWLKFFLPYAGEKVIKDDNKEIAINYCEEEMLILFLQYCLRMMWIEKNGSEMEYDPMNINWLRKEYIIRFEHILDTIIDEINCNSLSTLSCINYSLQINADKYPTKYCRGQHWNISDSNYIMMLNVFLLNIYNIPETKKDVIIWCYISNLPLVRQEKTILYTYLRFIKKVLNNNRRKCNQAAIEWNNWNLWGKNITYARYYVQGIPQYYTGCENEKCDSEFLTFIDSIISMNTRINLREGASYVYDYINECGNSKCKEILLKESKKEKSQDKDIIKKYEDLPFINGLIDRFLVYTEETCTLNDSYNNELYLKAFNNDFLDLSSKQYKHILKFTSENNMSINSILFSDIDVYWENYCGTKYTRKGSLMPHTWCDFFTCEEKINYNETQVRYPMHLLPDGWISDNDKVLQPQNTNVEGKFGFAGYGSTHEVGSICNFLDQFTSIRLDKESGFIIDNYKKDSLPSYLNEYNNDNWIIDKLRCDNNIYYSEHYYFNLMLVYMFKESSSIEEKDMNHYLKKNEQKMQYIQMYGNEFFVKLIID